MCQPISDFQTRHTQARTHYNTLRQLLHDHLVPRTPSQAYVIDGIVAEALGFGDADQRDRVELGLAKASPEQIEVALTRLDCLLGLTRAYVAYARHRDCTRRRNWFARLLRRG